MKSTGSGIREMQAFYALPECSVGKEQAKKQHGMTEAARLKAVRSEGCEVEVSATDTRACSDKLPSEADYYYYYYYYCYYCYYCYYDYYDYYYYYYYEYNPRHGQTSIITTLTPNPASRDPRAKQPQAGGGGGGVLKRP